MHLDNIVFVVTNNVKFSESINVTDPITVLRELDGNPSKEIDLIKISNNDIDLIKISDLSSKEFESNNFYVTRGFFLNLDLESHKFLLNLLNDSPLIGLINSQTSIKLLKPSDLKVLLNRIFVKYPDNFKEFLYDINPSKVVEPFKMHETFVMTRHLKVFVSIVNKLKELGTCGRHKVAAGIVKGKYLISSGYNGVKSGEQHCEDLLKSGVLKYEDHREWSKINEIHAEINAINLAKSRNEDLKDSIMILTHKPCTECVKRIYEVGIRTIIFTEDWTNDELVVDTDPVCNGVSVEEYCEIRNINLIHYQETL